MDFSDSMTTGPHSRLTALEGAWRGTATLWFEPGPPSAEDPVEIVVEPVLGGRAVRVATSVAGGDGPRRGELLFGYHLGAESWQATWIDEMHTGTQLMQLESVDAGEATPMRVLGSYPAGPSARWGWSISIEASGNELIVRHENIPPGGEPVEALLWTCTRVD